jgi:hypothetical protein
LKEMQFGAAEYAAAVAERGLNPDFFFRIDANNEMFVPDELAAAHKAYTMNYRAVARNPAALRSECEAYGFTVTEIATNAPHVKAEKLPPREYLARAQEAYRASGWDGVEHEAGQENPVAVMAIRAVQHVEECTTDVSAARAEKMQDAARVYVADALQDAATQAAVKRAARRVVHECAVSLGADLPPAVAAVEDVRRAWGKRTKKQYTPLDFTTLLNDRTARTWAARDAIDALAVVADIVQVGGRKNPRYTVAVAARIF